MSETELDQEVAPPASLEDRLIFGLRQAALLAVALLIAGLVTERLRPVAMLDRDIASTPFLWAIVVWLAVLVVHAVAFDHSQMGALEGTPLFGGLIMGAVVFVIGLVNLDGGSFGRRVVYLFANSLGAVMFWWAVISLVTLLVRRIADH